MKLEFGTSRRVIFGPGEFSRVGRIAGEFGKRALLVKGCSSLGGSGRLDEAKGFLQASEVEAQVISTDHEPTVAGIDDLAMRARLFNPDVIVAIGGGSAMDAAKALGVLLTHGDGSLVSVRNFLEGVGDQKIVSRSIPVIAIPTTAGTGSEVTKNAVIRSDDYSFKKSMRSPLMRPEVALVDPELSATMPPSVTASTGADAETQLIEAFTSRRSSILTDGFAREGMKLVAWALEHAYLNPEDEEAREAMAMASLLSGMALDNAGLGAVHGLASPIGAMFDIPHGVVCGNLLPDITEANIQVARQLEESDLLARLTVERYQEVACIFGGADCQLDELIEFLRFQRGALNIPSFASFGIHGEDIPEIINRCRAGSMKTNPVELSDEILGDLLHRLIK